MPLGTARVSVTDSGMLMYTLQAHSALCCDAAWLTVAVKDTQFNAGGTKSAQAVLLQQEHRVVKPSTDPVMDPARSHSINPAASRMCRSCSL